MLDSTSRLEAIPARGAAEPRREPAGARSLPALLEDRAARLGAEPALLAKAGGAWQAVSWGELARRVRDVADGLAALGVEHGDRVALLSQTRLEAVVADLGAMAAGAVSVPIYQTSTPREVEHVLRDSGALLVFCDGAEQVRKVREVREHLPRLRGLVPFEGPSGDGTEQPLAALEALGRAHGHDHPADHAERIAEIEPGDPACILYTSGTTGAPKGVVLTHGNWLYDAAALASIDEVRPDDLGLLFLPIAHSFGRLIIAAWIHDGSRIALAESVEKILENAREVRPTFIPAPPRLYEKIFGAVVAQGAAEPGLRGRLFRAAMASFDRWSAARDRGEDLHELGGLLARGLVLRKIGRAVKDGLGGRIRTLGSGSAPLSPRISRFFEAIGIPILEGYGMTEYSAAATSNRPDAPRHGTVGPPLPGTELRIAEDGEVLLRGPGVMAGYWNDPEATAEALRDGWLHTGDVGVLEPDGCLRITDRKKDVFKTSGGKMVAPQQIEKELAAAEPLLGHALVHGHARRFVSALVTLDPAAVRRWAAGEGVALSEPLERDPAVRARVARAIEAVNDRLPRFATIKRFAILPGEFTVGGGELTPTTKLRRRAIEEKYRDVLDGLYVEEAPAGAGPAPSPPSGRAAAAAAGPRAAPGEGSRVGGGGRGQLSPMPNAPRDLEQDADYRALVDALAREGLPRRAEAARAVEAVVCALAQRVAHEDFDELRERLPDPFRTRLSPCERHTVAPRTRFRGPEDFYEVVAEDLDRSPEEVEPTIRAVLAAVRAQLPERDAEDVALQLPAELQPLWRRPS